MTDHNAIRSRLFSIGHDILNVAVDAATGVLVAQTGDSVNGTVSSSGAEVWQQPGFASLPCPAQPGASGAQCVKLRSGDRDVIIATRDTRAANAVGNLVPGEAIMYATGANGSGSARVKCGADGAVSLGTTDTGQAGGNAVFLQVEPNALRFIAPWGALLFDATGFHVTCNNGPTLDMTIMGGLPGPLGAVSKVVQIVADAVVASAAKVLLGTGTFNPVAYSPALAAAAGTSVPIVTAGAAAAVTCISPVMTSGTVSIGS